jgi:hypothetical protein
VTGAPSEEPQRRRNITPRQSTIRI